MMRNRLSEMLQRLSIVIFLVACNARARHAGRARDLSESVSVCPGGQLMLSCIDVTNSTSALQWNVTVFPPSYLDPRESGTRLFTKDPEVSHEEPIIINQTVLHFSRTSKSPLTSVVSVVNVSNDLNQTRIECTDATGTALLVTFIHVIGNEANPRPTVSITDEQIGPNNVSVTLKWVQKGVTFSSVRPPADLRLTENMSAQLTIPYNVQHNVSIAVCSQPPVKVAELYYATCKDPGLVDDSLAMINYTPPAIEGSNITIKCSVNEGHLTTDNYTLMCTNGQWEPNLGHILAGCRDPGYTMPPVHVTTPASEHSATSATIISVSIAVTITIIVFFILGFVCSCFCQKYKQTFCKTSVVRSSTGTDSKVKDQESHDLEMTENVAYGPLDI